MPQTVEKLKSNMMPYKENTVVSKLQQVVVSLLKDLQVL